MGLEEYVLLEERVGIENGVEVEERVGVVPLAEADTLQLLMGLGATPLARDNAVPCGCKHKHIVSPSGEALSQIYSTSPPPSPLLWIIA